MSDNGHSPDCHLYRTGSISDEEAREILRRFNSSHWKNSRPTGGEVARYSIPADPNRDDDIRLDAYIAQTRELRAERDLLRNQLRVARDTLEEIMRCFRRDMDGRTHHENCNHLDCKAERALAAISQLEKPTR